MKQKIENQLLDAVLMICSIKCQKCGTDKTEHHASDYYFVQERMKEGWTVKRGKIICPKCNSSKIIKNSDNK